MASITANVKFTQRVLRKVDERVRIRPGAAARSTHANAGTTGILSMRFDRMDAFSSSNRMRQSILSRLAIMQFA